LNAGLALLVAGARNAADLARQLVPLVPAHWPQVKTVLAKVIAQGHVPEKSRGSLGKFLYFVGARDGM
jgi:hypothetical protein